MKKGPHLFIGIYLVVSIIVTLLQPDDITPPAISEDTIITDEERMNVFEACSRKSIEYNNLETL